MLQVLPLPRACRFPCRRDGLRFVPISLAGVLRLNVPPMLPQAKMKQAQRFQAFNAPRNRRSATLRMSALALLPMPCVEVTGMLRCVPRCPLECFRVGGLLILLWRREWDSNPR